MKQRVSTHRTSPPAQILRYSPLYPRRRAPNASLRNCPTRHMSSGSTLARHSLRATSTVPSDKPWPVEFPGLAELAFAQLRFNTPQLRGGSVVVDNAPRRIRLVNGNGKCFEQLTLVTRALLWLRDGLFVDSLQYPPLLGQ